MLDNSDGTVHFTPPERIWATQELVKGWDFQSFLGINSEGGWGFALYSSGSAHVPPYTISSGSAAQMFQTNPATFQTTTVFKPFSDQKLLDPNQGSAEANNPAVRADALAFAIPAQGCPVN